MTLRRGRSQGKWRRAGWGAEMFLRQNRLQANVGFIPHDRNSKRVHFYLLLFVIGIIIHLFSHYLCGSGGCGKNVQGRAVWKELDSLAVWPCMSYLISLSLTFLTSKIGFNSIPSPLRIFKVQRFLASVSRNLQGSVSLQHHQVALQDLMAIWDKRVTLALQRSASRGHSKVTQ